MRKIILSLLMIFTLVFSIYGWNYYNDYYLQISEKEVKEFLEKFNGDKIQILNFEQIENTNVWLAHFKSNKKQFGHAQFNEGWNHRLKFINFVTDPNVTYKEYDTNKGKYGVLFVGNLDNNISKIKINSQLKNYEIEINITSSKPFMKAFSLPKNIDNTSPASFSFYDKSGNFINE